MWWQQVPPSSSWMKGNLPWWQVNDIFKSMNINEHDVHSSFISYFHVSESWLWKFKKKKKQSLYPLQFGIISSSPRFWQLVEFDGKAEVFPRTFIHRLWASRKLLVCAEDHFLTVGAMPIYSKLQISHFYVIGLTGAVQGNCGFIFGKYKLKCALLWRTWDFHHPNPPGGLELDVSAGAGFGTRGKAISWLSFKLSKKPCIWLSPVSLTFKSVSRFFWLTGGFHWWYFAYRARNCHKPSFGSRCWENGA